MARGGIDKGVGSPPRRRGRPGVGRRVDGADGLTPAQAGTASSTGFPECWTTGSPPRRRGRRGPPGARQVRIGLTPAQAGTAGTPGLPPRRSGAHPRAGGDGLAHQQQVAQAQGSPPRRRGRQRHAPRGGHPRGLTPAQAGTADCRMPMDSCLWAHPRAGGDGEQVSGHRRASSGSPPRRRGRPQPCCSVR